jgi:concentrative nucleoside transporter, CNT family
LITNNIDYDSAHLHDALVRPYPRAMQADTDRCPTSLLYGMCGFANFGSLGIMIAGLVTMAPERRDDVVSLGFKSIASGTLSTCLIGAVVGALT